MTLEVIATEGAPKALGPYSQAIAHGELVFCAGQVALDPASGQIVGSTTGEQTCQVLRNLAAVLEAAGSDLAHVVKTTVFMTDIGDFAEMNAVYEQAFAGHRPARSTVPIAALPRGAKVEIECIAIRKS